MDDSNCDVLFSSHRKVTRITLVLLQKRMGRPEKSWDVAGRVYGEARTPRGPERDLEEPQRQLEGSLVLKALPIQTDGCKKR